MKSQRDNPAVSRYTSLYESEAVRLVKEKEIKVEAYVFTERCLYWFCCDLDAGEG